MEEKIFTVGSHLQTSVRTKLMAVGGHYKDEKAIESVYTNLKELSLWKVPKDTHTQNVGNMKNTVICVLVLHEY